MMSCDYSAIMIINLLGKYHSSSLRWLHSNEKFFSWITRYVTIATIHYIVLTKLIEIKFALNEDLVVGQEASRRSMYNNEKNILYSICTIPAHSNVVLDDCKFHECVNLSEFEHDKVLHITPPDGEVSAHMIYTASSHDVYS